MAVTAASFRNTFGEFRKADTGEINAKLVLARLEVNAAIWGARTDSGVLWMTAHMLATAPAGQNAKLKPADSGKTVYLQMFDRIKKSAAFGFRVAGMPSADAFDLARAGVVE